LTGDQRKAMLAATPRIQSDEAKVKELAEKIIGREPSVQRKAELLVKWVHEKMRATVSDNPNTTLECWSGWRATASITPCCSCRWRGQRAFRRERSRGRLCGTGIEVVRLACVGGVSRRHQWVSVDPTWDEERVDATHVKFSDSAEDMAWVNVLGKVKFKVVEVKQK